ncbi:TetR/AcrR family transcriptional regulator [Mycobacterium sp. AT1]|uniref:TetR/AcrR family transcriptional regulator n=1 Tax=Mycobacterium sp. AT1 TaxID=1961706 RepID=UPI0009AC6317|nr:TetR family transcriptional regulator [Mycobacterium sp. AT1]OPX07774.1 transcriptional regulator [Mycobacterium sp. AT1]
MARKKDQEARRVELGDAVRRAVLTRGLEGVRLRDIAEHAGVTPAAVLYYGDVDALTYDTYKQAIERFSQERERVAERFPDARDRLRASIDHGVATGPDDELVRLLFEFWPRSLRDPKAAALDSSLSERQIAVYSAIFTLGETQGHFILSDPPRMLAGNVVAMEDGYQMEVLSGRRSRDEVKLCLYSYARAVTGCEI